MKNVIDEEGIKRGLFLLFMGIALIGFLFVGGSNLFTVTVPAGHVGVIYNAFGGGVQASEQGEGFYLKAPWETYTLYSVRTQEYTMTAIHGEGAVSESDTISALTEEGLMVELDLTVYYRVLPDKADELHQKIGPDYVAILIRPQARAAIRDVVAKHTAKEIYSVERGGIANQIYELLEASLENRPILIERVVLRNVNIPQTVKIAIENKLKAEQEAEQMKFVLQKETQEAERKRIEAAGIKDAQAIISESLTEPYLKWYWIEHLEDHNSVIYVPIDQTALPLFRNVEGAQ